MLTVMRYYSKYCFIIMTRDDWIVGCNAFYCFHQKPEALVSLM
jgi:hypothetical protein